MLPTRKIPAVPLALTQVLTTQQSFSCLIANRLNGLIGNIVSSGAGRQTNSQAGAVGGGGTNKDDNSWLLLCSALTDGPYSCELLEMCISVLKLIPCPSLFVADIWWGASTSNSFMYNVVHFIKQGSTLCRRLIARLALRFLPSRRCSWTKVLAKWTAASLYTKSNREISKKIGISEASKWRNFWRTFPHHSALKTCPSLDFDFLSLRRQLFWPLSFEAFSFVAG